MYEQGDGPGFSTEAWTSVKPDLGLDFPNLPYFIDGEVRLTETLAILKYVAAKYGQEKKMLGETVEDQGRVEMLAHVLADTMMNATMPCYVESDKLKVSEVCLKLMQPIVAYLETTKGTCLVGNNLTYVDFMLFELCERVQFITDGRLFLANRRLQTYH